MREMLFMETFDHDDDDDHESDESFASSAVIKDADYHAADVAKVAQDQKHLIVEQRNELQQVLEKFPTLLDGTLKKYPHSQIHLDLIPGSTPIHTRPYNVPRMHLDVFQKELIQLVEIGVRKKCGATEWAAPTFIIPKKESNGSLGIGLSSTEQMSQTKSISFADHCRYFETTSWLRILFEACLWVSSNRQTLRKRSWKTLWMAYKKTSFDCFGKSPYSIGSKRFCL
jgi:hypothetical protein